MRKLLHHHRDHARKSRFALAAFIPRRGVAMLLVIICVMTATILAMSYLSSRDNSLAISENSIDTSAARWSALSGLDIAIATLQTESDWRTVASDGVLLDSYPFFGGELAVHIADADTGNPPTADTVLANLLAIVSGQNGMEHTAHALAAVVTPTQGLFQIDLADFGLFADESIRLNGGALVARWETAPRTRFGLPISIGVRSTNVDSIQIGGSSRVVDGWAHYQEDAPFNLVDSSQVLRRVEMKDFIPLPDAPSPGVAEPGILDGHLNLVSNVALVTKLVWNQITVQEGRQLRLPDDRTVVVGDLTLLPYGHILVEGDTTLVVFGDVDLQRNSYIEIARDATLRMYVAGDVALDQAYIGRERADKSRRDTSGSAVWMDPDRIQLLGFGDGDSGPMWMFDDTSVVKASMYTPRAAVIVDNASAVYGRIAARQIRVRNLSSLYYDHTLDRFAGYTNSRSILFDTDGYILPVFKDMSAIDTDELGDVADETGVQFRVLSRSIGTSGSLYGLDGVSIDDPTPRPIAVDYQLLSAGMEPRDMEVTAP